jgi:hypothetical protein
MALALLSGWVFFITYLAPLLMQLTPSAGMIIGGAELLPENYYFWTSLPPGLRIGEGLPWLWWFLFMDVNLLMILVIVTMVDHARLFNLEEVWRGLRQPYRGFLGLGLILVITINLFPILSVLIGAPHPLMTVYLFTLAMVINLTVPFGMNYDWKNKRAKVILSIAFSWIIALALTVIFASDLYPNAGLITRPLMKTVFDMNLFGPATSEISLIWIEFLLWNLVITLGLWTTCFDLHPFKKRGRTTGLAVLLTSVILALVISYTWDYLLGVPWGRNPNSGLATTKASEYVGGETAYWHWTRLSNIMWAAILIGIGPSAKHIWHNCFSKARLQPKAGVVNLATGFLTVMFFFLLLWSLGSILYPGWNWMHPLADFPGYGGSSLLAGLNPYMIMSLWIGGTTLQGFLWAYLNWNLWFNWWPLERNKNSIAAT